jgi:hypothetical protein
VVAQVDLTTNPLRSPDGPVLLERSSSDDRRCVVTSRLVDVVCAAVAVDGALVLRSGARVIVAEGLDDVVLDKRVGGPPVDGEVAVSGGVE